MSYLQPLLLAAKQYWGEPNERLTTAKQIRYGAHGSKAVDLEKETWYDHEMDKGGGLADLIHLLEDEDPELARRTHRGRDPHRSRGSGARGAEPAQTIAGKSAEERTGVPRNGEPS